MSFISFKPLQHAEHVVYCGGVAAHKVICNLNEFHQPGWYLCLMSSSCAQLSPPINWTGTAEGELFWKCFIKWLSVVYQRWDAVNIYRLCFLKYFIMTFLPFNSEQWTSLFYSRVIFMCAFGLLHLFHVIQFATFDSLVVWWPVIKFIKLIYTKQHEL